jgi:uncharacterized secreted protein with C-terminal beta-propeller domain
MTKIAGTVVVILGAAIVVFLFLGLSSLHTPQQNFSDQATLKKFASYDELDNFLKTNSESGSYSYYSGLSMGAGAVRDMATTSVPAAENAASKSIDSTQGAGSDFSSTNVQVAGVDEPDIVKNDGRYIYVVSGNNLSIVDAYPAESAKLLSTIDLNGIREIFVNNDKLIVFGNDYNYGYAESATGKVAGSAVSSLIMPPYRSSDETFIRIYDISDRSNPVLSNNITVEGNYFDARMIGDNVYLIINKYVYYGGVIPLPMIRANGAERMIAASDIYYFDYSDYSYQFTTIFSVNTQSGETNSKVILTGTTQNIYVSSDNIYLTYQKHVSNTYMTDRMINEVLLPLMPSDVIAKINEIKNTNLSEAVKSQSIMMTIQEYYNTLTPEQRDEIQKQTEDKINTIQAEIAKELDKTVVQKISINNGAIELKATGEFTGRLLNQFSMDEYNGYFRVATTSGQYWTGTAETKSKNNIYVLDQDLKVVGSLEDLAKGESIYSARFMGDRAYLVTFRQVDPLFVIGLSDPTNPQVLGQLKIPGYSNYLHPYDENHVIGIGKDVDESIDADKVHSEGSVYYTAILGVKISLFDVSDVAHPVEVSKYVIGDRGTDSLALQDHKAFLFDKNKNLLVIPITLVEVDRSKYPNGVPSEVQGDYTFQGAYVFNIDPSGITLRGRVTNMENDTDLKKAGYYYYGDGSSIERSLYIGNVLYTISKNMVKASDLITLSEISKVSLPYSEYYYPLYYASGGVGIAAGGTPAAE